MLKNQSHIQFDKFTEIVEYHREQQMQKIAHIEMQI